MKKILFLLFAVLFMTSCSRIITKDYEVVDRGVISSIDYHNYKVTLEYRSGLFHEWLVQNPFDGFSLKGLAYVDSLQVGDRCFVYKSKDNETLISKVNVNDAKIINKALFNFYWRSLLFSEWFWGLLFMAILMVAITMFVARKKVSVFLFVITTGVAIVGMSPGRKLVKIDEGQISKIHNNCVFVDDKTVYSTSVNDLFSEKPLSLGQNVVVYSYQRGETQNSIGSCRRDIFLSLRNFDEITLKVGQIYPEIMLYSALVYWFMLLILWLICKPIVRIFFRR